MKNKEKYDLRNILYVIKWKNCKCMFIVYCNHEEIHREIFNDSNSIGSAYANWLEEEYDPKILTDKEKAYLSAVIKPFREDVKCIMKFKRYPVEKEFIRICMKDNYDNCTLPDFEKGTMYKGMERGKEYTLEELGL